MRLRAIEVGFRGEADPGVVFASPPFTSAFLKDQCK